MDIEKFLMTAVGSLSVISLAGWLIADYEWSTRATTVMGFGFLISALINKHRQEKAAGQRRVPEESVQ
ncbi:MULTISPECIES: hypothetical protein [Corynebacterium]|uniref:Uncharacterized protein n=1 Tax=Corynebacterium guaraldiae TaxID=3051103 RepID=A0ABY3CWE8_9CORY|nr:MULTISPECIES: hypothetical protein [Corynebacterium]OFP86398.1 hypothetical protein HMPREF2967_11565 [Corynebacterium sp. HMSC059E07]TRX32017.1 hypothetical protein FNY86_11050 [Corynebacterium guaraldiae]TRX43179.1 hypothetical protein FNY89_01475 [Corynebacterium guaraldiae]TRX50729.1 hypothetical protein FNY88_00930 [Corynebacterium guaraldiae]TRX52097.1 hypothetical protein FNY91_07465 [Corynebacterium guaraldiae]